MRLIQIDKSSRTSGMAASVLKVPVRVSDLLKISGKLLRLKGIDNWMIGYKVKSLRKENPDTAQIAFLCQRLICHWAIKPPSKTNGCPVIYDDFSEHSQITASATSSMVPLRPMGIGYIFLMISGSSP